MIPRYDLFSFGSIMRVKFSPILEQHILRLTNTNAVVLGVLVLFPILS